MANPQQKARGAQLHIFGQSSGKGTIVIHRRNISSPTTDYAAASAAEVAAMLLLTLEDAAISYERLLATGPAPGDHELARDPNYARLLNAGQCILRIGGYRATAHAARLIARQVPEGSVEHFDRLWCGLMPQGSD